MKKNTLMIGIGVVLAFIAYRYFSKAKAPAINIANSSIAKEENVTIEPTVVPVPAPVVGMPTATSMPGTAYATYVDLGWTGDGILVNGDKVEVLKSSDNTYIVHKIIGNSTYVAGSITLPINALVF